MAGKKRNLIDTLINRSKIFGAFSGEVRGAPSKKPPKAKAKAPKKPSAQAQRNKAASVANKVARVARETSTFVPLAVAKGLIALAKRKRKK